MIPPFDIFRLEKDRLETDVPLWVAVAPTLEEARSHVQAAGKLKPGRYMIRSIQTARQEYIMVDEKRSVAAARSCTAARQVE